MSTGLVGIWKNRVKNNLSNFKIINICRFFDKSTIPSKLCLKHLVSFLKMKSKRQFFTMYPKKWKTYA